MYERYSTPIMRHRNDYTGLGYRWAQVVLREDDRIINRSVEVIAPDGGQDTTDLAIERCTGD